MKNSIKKASLTAAAAALVGMSAPVNASTQDPASTATSTSQNHEPNTRIVRGTLGHERYTDVYVPNGGGQYKAYYIDTDGDLLEDHICFEIVSDDKLRTDYKPGTHMIITEVRGADGTWIISKIDVEKSRRILMQEKSR